MYIYIYIYITDVDDADDLAFLANTPAQTESLLLSLEQATGGIGLHVNPDKTDYMCFNKRDDIFILNNGSLNQDDKLEVASYLRKMTSIHD